MTQLLVLLLLTDSIDWPSWLLCVTQWLDSIDQTIVIGGPLLDSDVIGIVIVIDPDSWTQAVSPDPIIDGQPNDPVIVVLLVIEPSIIIIDDPVDRIGVVIVISYWTRASSDWPDVEPSDGPIGPDWLARYYCWTGPIVTWPSDSWRLLASYWYWYC